MMFMEILIMKRSYKPITFKSMKVLAIKRAWRSKVIHDLTMIRS